MDEVIREIEMSWMEIAVCCMMITQGVIHGEDAKALGIAMGPLTAAIKNHVSEAAAHQIIRKMRDMFKPSVAPVEIIIHVTPYVN